MTAILGISGFYHDSAAALVIDGELIAAAQEERFTRRKHENGFPRQAIEYCLTEAGLADNELDYVGLYEKPLLKFDRLLQTYLAVAPRGYRSFATAIPLWLKEKLHVSRIIRRELGQRFQKRVAFAGHHEAHAASAFFPSPFDEAAILTVDGVGEWATASFGSGQGSRIELTNELRFPHSLGLLYSAFTQYCGFKVDSGEYKLMGLAPYGKPVLADRIRQKLVDVKPDGSLRLDMRHFNYCSGLTMINRRFEHLFGQPKRKSEGELTQHYKDVAASIQLVTEDVLLKMAHHVHRLTGQKRLCLAGGVALNCVANGRLLREGPFEDLWIQPAAGDAGGALGAALLIWHQLLDKPREPRATDTMRGSLLGPAFTESQIENSLRAAGAVFRTVGEDAELLQQTAALLSAGKVVGWFQGRMEFGPRALGNRSILGDPRDPQMQSRMNQKIKFRESFRPFAPAVLAEHAGDHFEMDGISASPYMLLTTQVRSDLPAITHVDGSARVQTVDAGRNPRFAGLLEEFHRQTGCPVLINTSFNVRGEPIVCTPAEACRCFLRTEMDALIIGNRILLKEEQPAVTRDRSHIDREPLGED
ncbi:carbamoyltransferase family protein [Rubinisphaera margarita]|uniref:carbamoyltransferase family protein n=1 Tax=Rubinisphaera margarita TaxID=2909586 RepID=UPI001EE95CE1|nr:carbamoyltransferase [Rubinisphaera margarita]MCG6157596.1 carbamoyltransferase [Rubinisphaera margarita]